MTGQVLTPSLPRTPESSEKGSPCSSAAEQHPYPWLLRSREQCRGPGHGRVVLREAVQPESVHGLRMKRAGQTQVHISARYLPVTFTASLSLPALSPSGQG